MQVAKIIRNNFVGKVLTRDDLDIHIGLKGTIYDKTKFLQIGQVLDTWICVYSPVHFIGKASSRTSEMVAARRAVDGLKSSFIKGICSTPLDVRNEDENPGGMCTEEEHNEFMQRMKRSGELISDPFQYNLCSPFERQVSYKPRQ